MTTKSLPQLLLEAEEKFDELIVKKNWPVDDYEAVKSFLQETILSILSEAEKATEVEERKGWSQFESEHYEIGYEDCRRKFKSKWREWRGDNSK